MHNEERQERALVAGAVIGGTLLATDFPLLFKIAEEELCLREASERYQKCLAENPPPPTVTDLESFDAEAFPLKCFSIFLQ